MCQSKDQGGRRCVNKGTLASNYPSSIGFDHKAKSIILLEESFDKNPQLVLHVAVLAARSGYSITPETISKARLASKRFSEISQKQLWEQWNGIITSPLPSEGLKAIHQLGWEHHFPELAAIRGVKQSPIWHPEGDVEIHTQEAADVAAKLAKEQNLNARDTRIAVMSAICHDLGKSVSTTIDAEGNISSADHEKTGVPLAKSFLLRIGADNDTLREVPILVREHMCHVHTPTIRSTKNLIVRLKGIPLEAWARLAESDRGGRGNASTSGISQEWLKMNEIVNNRDEKYFKRIVDGKFLKKAGSLDYNNYGAILKESTKAQNLGIITDNESGMKWLHENNYI